MVGIILIILSIYVMARGELKISSKSVIKGTPARWLGVYLFLIAIGVQYIFFPTNLYVSFPLTIFLPYALCAAPNTPFRAEARLATKAPAPLH